MTQSIQTVIKRFLLRITGRLYEVEGKDLVELDAGSNCEYYRYQFIAQNQISSGWYMLSIAGSKLLLAKRLDLSVTGEHIATMQIAPRSFSKRIVKICSTAGSLFIETNIPPDHVSFLELSLTRITRSYAISRMQRKLRYSSNLAPGAGIPKLDSLYCSYTRIVDRYRYSISYKDWYQSHKTRRLQAFAGVNPLMDRSSFIIVRLDEQNGTTQEVASGHPINAACEYICYIGPDAILESDFVQSIEVAIANNPDALLLYPDHDVLTRSNDRVQPCFKPGWNPEMLLTGNYIGQVIVVKRSVCERQGAPDLSLGSSALYAYLLKLSPLLADSTVCRIPEVLYSYPESRQGVDSYLSSGVHDRKSLLQALKERGYKANVMDGLIRSLNAVNWQLPVQTPTVDIVIPSKNNVQYLRRCVDSVLGKTDYPYYQITVVDNGSTEKETGNYYKEMSSHQRFTLLKRPGEFNYSALNNYAVSQTDGQILVLLNDDTEVIGENWLTNLVAQAARPEVACVGAKLYYSSGEIQHAGVIMGIFGMAGHAHRLFDHDHDGYCGRLKIAHNVSAVTAACLAVKRSIYIELGQLDEVNLKVAYNDVDFCLRAREAGYQNIWTPHVELYHHESVSRGSENTRRKQQRFEREFSFMQRRWQVSDFDDNAYNPNLALNSEDFALAA